MSDISISSVIDRITAYLSGGGLWNPELANHDHVRDLLLDCRNELVALRQPPADVVPSAWLITSKRGLVRCAITTAPTQDHIDCAECDGDTITPLYAHPAAVPADVAGLSKTVARVRRDMEKDPQDFDPQDILDLCEAADALTALAQERDRQAKRISQLETIIEQQDVRNAQNLLMVREVQNRAESTQNAQRARIAELEAQLEQSAFLLRDEQNRRVAAQDELAEARRDAGRYQCYRVQNPSPPSIAFATPEQRDAFYDAAIQEGKP